ncbi:MAG: hypothetical protein HQL87_01995 [Magnetococcales bacterium]|nr:hypothetical protein [Magnetococcales bacterium]
MLEKISSQSCDGWSVNVGIEGGKRFIAKRHCKIGVGKQRSKCVGDDFPCLFQQGGLFVQVMFLGIRYAEQA